MAQSKPFSMNLFVDSITKNVITFATQANPSLSFFRRCNELLKSKIMWINNHSWKIFTIETFQVFSHAKKTNDKLLFTFKHILRNNLAHCSILVQSHDLSQHFSHQDNSVIFPADIHIHIIGLKCKLQLLLKHTKRNNNFKL